MKKHTNKRGKRKSFSVLSQDKGFYRKKSDFFNTFNIQKAKFTC